MDLYIFTDIPEGANARRWFEAVRPPHKPSWWRALLRYCGTAVFR